MKIQEKPDYLIFADSAKKGEVIDFPDVSRGWGVTIEQTGSKPPLEWMNGAFNRVDKNMLYLLQQGVPEWSESVKYPSNAIIKYNGVLYTAIAENDNINPSTDSTKWKKTQAEIPNASTNQVGKVQLSSSTDSDSETQAATPLAVKRVNDLLQSISVKFHCYEKETRVYSGDKKQYIFVRDDGVSGFVDKDGKIKWGFNDNGCLDIGTVPVSKISDLTFNSSTNSESETEAATPKAVKRVNDLLQSISVKFHCYEKETRVYSGDKKHYIFVRDDGVSGFVGDEGKIKWAFNKDGNLFEGFVPSNRVTGFYESVANTFNQSFGQNGYTRLPNGLIIQWGIANYNSSDSSEGTIHSFYAAFPHACLSISANDTGTGVNTTSISPISTAQFKCWGRTTINDSPFRNTTLFYIAIGY